MEISSNPAASSLSARVSAYVWNVYRFSCCPHHSPVVNAVQWNGCGSQTQSVAAEERVRRENIELDNHFKEAIKQSLDKDRENNGGFSFKVPNCHDSKNYSAFCSTYRQAGFCDSYPYGMKKHCPLTCGFCKCKAKIDVAFLVDSSSSINKAGKENFQKCLDFIKTAANSSYISEQYVHMGVVLYSSKVNLLFDFNKFFDSRQILHAIDNAPYMGGGTLTGKALEYTRKEVLEKGVRKGVPQVLIVMTDGISTDTVEAAARKLHQIGVTVFTVGIGANFDKKQLETIASKPRNKFALVTDIDRIYGVYNAIRDYACRINDTPARDYPSRHAQSARVSKPYEPSLPLRRPVIHVVR